MRELDVVDRFRQLRSADRCARYLSSRAPGIRQEQIVGLHQIGDEVAGLVRIILSCQTEPLLLRENGRVSGLDVGVCFLEPLRP